MSDTEETAFAARLESLTETYVADVTACTGTLAPALEQYGTDSEAFTASVERVDALESDCDETVRELRRRMTGAVPADPPGVYLMAGNLVEFHALVDDVPNRSESFLRDLSVMRPTVPADVLRGLTEAGGLAHRATEHLVAATLAYTESIVRPGVTFSAGDHIERVRTLERECDDLVHDVLRDAFERRPPERALVLRELGVELAGVADAAEDAADQLEAMTARTV